MATSRIDSATQGAIKPYRSTAIVVGVVYLLGFVVGLGGEGLIQSILGAPDRLSSVATNSTMLAVGAVLWLMAVIGDAAHGVLMFPVLRQHSERAALGYLAARIVDAAFIALMVLFVLVQVALGSEYLHAGPSDAFYLQASSNVAEHASQSAYQIGMSALSVSGVILCYTLYRARLVPRFVAVWGLLGYAVIFVGMLSEILGSGLGLASSIPGGLWEVFMGVWLIVKGFSGSTAPSERTVPLTATLAVPEAVSATA